MVSSLWLTFRNLTSSPGQEFPADCPSWDVKFAEGWSIYPPHVFLPLDSSF